MSASAVLELGANLESEDTDVVLAAAWDVFGMITQLADDITFDEGSDELQAMIVAQRCSEGLDRLPLPQTGRPVKAPPPEPGAASLAPYVQLLEHVSVALTRLSAGEVADEASTQALVEVGELASGAAVALSFVRGQ